MDVTAFARETARVLADPLLGARLGAAARATVEREYSWDVLGVKLRRQYHRAIARRKNKRGALAST
jgi:glycosyltransferase involved in cell wall biosynthesis